MELTKLNIKVFKVSLMPLTHLSDELFRVNTHLISFEHDRSPVRIISADVMAFITLHLLKTNPYISLNILQKMTKVDFTIGIGKR